jgi:hypothetical protein
MKESIAVRNAAVFAVVTMTILLFMHSSALGIKVAPSKYLGTKWVAIADELKKIKADARDPDIPEYERAVLHQYAFAKKTKEILVDVYGEDSTGLPSLRGFPIYYAVVPAKNKQENDAATEHLKKAIESFKAVVEMKGPFSRDDIGGMQGSSLRLKFKAAMGLCWCLHEQGSIEEARGYYPRLLKWARETDHKVYYKGYEENQVLAWKLIRPHVGDNKDLKPTFKKSREIGVDELLQEWKKVAPDHESALSVKMSMARLHALVYATHAKSVFVIEREGSQKLYVVGEQDSPLSQPVMNLEDKDGVYRKHLDTAIALYVIILSVPEKDHQRKSEHPWMVAGDRLDAKLELEWALSQFQPRAKTIERLTALLEETIAHDKEKDDDMSIELWRFTQQFLDPEKDRELIQKTNLRFKKLELKTYPPRG